MVSTLHASRTQFDEPANFAANTSTLSSANPSEAPIDDDAMRQAIDSLYSTLNAEIDQRRALESELEALRVEVVALRAGASEAPTASQAEERVAQLIEARENRLTEFGFTPAEREDYQRMQAAAQFKAIELDDRARREGWHGTARYQDEFRALALENNPVREELGDARYDEFLYATGQPNRLVVNNVVPSSPAEAAGFRQGDVIVRYDGVSVFSNNELLNLRSTGDAGENISVEIVRDGDPVVLDIPRGPLGILANGQIIDPRTNTLTGGR